MQKEVSFIHVADLHLDSPFKGMSNVPDSLFEELRKSTFQSFENIVQVAIQKQVDFILLVGDLFEHEKQSLRAQVFLRDCFEKLRANQIQVYLSYGNHDYISGNKHRLTFPENVHVFPNENVQAIPFEKNGIHLANIYGFSYENRVILDNKSHEFQLQNLSVPFHIGMLHGSLNGIEGHDPYAPFLISDLKSNHFNYWALGHIHQRQVISENPHIIYPGNIQGRHRNEANEKGCYYVQLTESGTKAEFIPTQHILFQHVTFDIAAFQTMEEIHHALKHLLEQYKEYHHFIQLDIVGSAEQNDWEQEKILAEMIELWNEEQVNQEVFTFVYRYDISYRSSAGIQMTDLFMQEVELALQDEAMYTELVQSLMRHRQLGPHLSELEMAEIREKAKQVLLQSLHGREVMS